MTIGISEPGFLILDPKLNPIACNQQAITILTFPNLAEQVKRVSVFLADKIRFSLGSWMMNPGSDIPMVMACSL